MSVQELLTYIVLGGSALGALRQWVVMPLVKEIRKLNIALANHDADHDYVRNTVPWNLHLTDEVNRDRLSRGLSPVQTPPQHPYVGNGIEH